MTPKEIVAERLRCMKVIGGRADIFIHIGRSVEQPLSAMCYLNGIVHSDDRRFGVDAVEWDELFEKLMDRWREYESKYLAETVRKMALEIIKITAERGECTEAALRACCDFTPDQVDSMLDRAIDDANKIAANGPFTVRRMSGNGGH
jgi:hypothetical protein